MIRRRRICVGAATGLGALAMVAPAGATEGSLYSFGLGGPVEVAQSVPDDQCSARLEGTTIGVTCPPSAPALGGVKWQIDFRSRIPGTQIEGLGWRAVRFHGVPTSIEQQVLADGIPVWRAAEQDIPRSPAPPKGYGVGLRASVASLGLRQVETRQQPNRVWTFVDPTVAVRDVQPPSATLAPLAPGWITSPRITADWTVIDNFGSDGIGGQRFAIDDGVVWSGAPGDGAHAVSLDLSGVADGTHQLLLDVDGDGTAPAERQTTALQIDRTPPTGTLDVVPVSADRVRVVVAVADGASGVRRWILRARDENGRVVASGTASRSQEIDLSDLAVQGETIRFFATVDDNAGHTAVLASPAVTRAAVPVVLSGSQARLGPPGRILAAGVALPNFSRVGTLGLKSLSARRYGRSGRQLVPILVARYGRPVRLRGRFFHPNGRGLRGATVYLVDPIGRAQGTTLTDRRGRFAFRPRPRVPGVWRAIALGRPLVVSPAVIVVRPRVRARVQRRAISAGGRLRIAGVIRPRGRARAKIVQLQWRQGDAWRPLDQTRADRTGRFRLTYRVSPLGGGYSTLVRVVVPREKGWPFAPVVATRFRLRVN